MNYSSPQDALEVSGGSAESDSARVRPPLARVTALVLLLVIVASAGWWHVGLPRWRAAQYQRASLAQLIVLCGNGDYGAADALMQKAIAARSSERAVPPLERCWALAAQGKLSIPISSKAEVAGDLALAMMLSGREGEAAPLFTLSTQLDYECVPAHLAAAFWYFGHDDDQHALAELQTVTALDPRNDLAWFEMAHIYDQNNFLDKGRAAARKAIAINPNVASYWQELGDSFGYADRHQESVKPYEQELKLDPNSAAAQADVARSLAFTAVTPAQYEEALKRVNTVLRNKPLNPGGGYALLGDLQLKFGHFQEARRALETALTYDSSIPDTYYKLARAQRLSGDDAAAARTMARYQDMYGHYQRTRVIQKRLSESPKDASLHLALAHAWEYYKAWPQALQEYEAVAQLRAGDAEATRKIAEIRAMAKNGQLSTPQTWVLASLLRASAPVLRVPPSPGSSTAPGAPPVSVPQP